MSYRCLTCHYKGRHFPNGRCPGCDSGNIQREKQAEEVEKKKERSTTDIVLLVLFWGLFAYAIWKNFIQ